MTFMPERASAPREAPWRRREGELPPRGERVAAFFDLDGTLLTANSGGLWMKRERRAGRLGRRTYLKGLLYLAAYRVNVLDMDAAMREALATIRGKREAEVREDTRRWYFEEVAPLVAPGALPVLGAHRRRGHLLVLLTASSPYESEAAAEHLGLDDWLSSRYEVVDGRFTGEPVPPLCFGEGKVVHARRWAAEAGVDLGRSYFYTDSRSDLPMLLAVGEPRVVNPDLRLRRHARRRGWPVLDWRAPALAAAG